LVRSIAFEGGRGENVRPRMYMRGRDFKALRMVGLKLGEEHIFRFHLILILLPKQILEPTFVLVHIFTAQHYLYHKQMQYLYAIDFFQLYSHTPIFLDLNPCLKNVLYIRK
jgi:hypothetical protein